jgi:signal transduction histidine kinase
MRSPSRNWEPFIRAFFLLVTALIPVLTAAVVYLQFSTPPLVPLDLLSLLNALVVAGTFWAVGALLLWRRFWDPVARLFFLMTQSIGTGLVFFLAYPEAPSRLDWMVIAISVGFHLAGSLLFHFYLTFPVVLGNPRQRRRLLTAVYSLMFVALACRLSGTAWGLRLTYLYNTTEIMGAVATLFYAYWRRATPDAQRRLRLVVFGGAASAVPGFLFYLLPTILGSPQRMPDWMVGPFILIAPLSYFVAIVRHNLFDLDRLLNRTLVYAILSLGILLLYLGPFLLLYRWMPDDWLAQVLIVAGLTLLVGMGFDWTRGRVERFVDRIFYGGWYDYPGVVETISDALARSIEREQLTEVLTRRVPALMQLRQGQLLLADGEITPSASLPPQLQFPLAFQAQTRGVWIVGARRDGEDFGFSDRRILKTLARQAEVALGNVLLVEMLRRQLDEIRESRETLAQAQRQLLYSREEERARLARDLHDGPIQDLVGLNMQLGLLLSSAAPALSESLASMRLQVRALLSDLRHVCAELRPPMLDTMGLGAALRVLGGEWSSQTGLPVHLDLPPDVTLRTLPGQVAVNLYRLAQEALANVARHAAAHSVGIQLEWVDGSLILTICDDGRGFAVPATFLNLAAQGHFGLLGMQERIGLIGGECTIDSATGQGTSVRAVWRGAAGPEPMVDPMRA